MRINNSGTISPTYSEVYPSLMQKVTACVLGLLAATQSSMRPRPFSAVPLMSLLPLTQAQSCAEYLFGGDVVPLGAPAMGFQGVESVIPINETHLFTVYQEGGSGGNQASVWGQWITPKGGLLSLPFSLSGDADSDESSPGIAKLLQGFVTVWTRRSASLPGYEVVARQWNDLGQWVGEEIRVNTYQMSNQWDGFVVGLPDGGFFTSWTSLGQDGSESGVYAQRFGPEGEKIGPEFLVPTHTDNHQWYARSCVLNSGKIVTAWVSAGEDGSGSGIYAQIVGPNGKEGGPFQLNTEIQGGQNDVRLLALPSGGFVTVWTSNRTDGSAAGVYFQRFDAQGGKVGPQKRVSTYTEGSQWFASIERLTDGRLIAAWRDDHQNAGVPTLYGQLLTEDGDKIGDPFRLDSGATRRDESPHLLALADRAFLSTWTRQSYQAGQYRMQARHFVFSDSPNAPDDLNHDPHTITLPPPPTPPPGWGGGGVKITFTGRSTYPGETFPPTTTRAPTPAPTPAFLTPVLTIPIPCPPTPAPTPSTTSITVTAIFSSSSSAAPTSSAREATSTTQPTTVTSRQITTNPMFSSEPVFTSTTSNALTTTSLTPSISRASTTQKVTKASTTLATSTTPSQAVSSRFEELASSSGGDSSTQGASSTSPMKTEEMQTSSLEQTTRPQTSFSSRDTTQPWDTLETELYSTGSRNGLSTRQLSVVGNSTFAELHEEEDSPNSTGMIALVIVGVAAYLFSLLGALLWLRRRPGEESQSLPELGHVSVQNDVEPPKSESLFQWERMESVQDTDIASSSGNPSEGEPSELASISIDEVHHVTIVAHQEDAGLLMSDESDELVRDARQSEESSELDRRARIADASTTSSDESYELERAPKLDDNGGVSTATLLESGESTLGSLEEDDKDFVSFEEE